MVPDEGPRAPRGYRRFHGRPPLPESSGQGSAPSPKSRSGLQSYPRNQASASLPSHRVPHRSSVLLPASPVRGRSEEGKHVLAGSARRLVIAVGYRTAPGSKVTDLPSADHGSRQRFACVLHNEGSTMDTQGAGVWPSGVEPPDHRTVRPPWGEASVHGGIAQGRSGAPRGARGGDPMSEGPGPAGGRGGVVEESRRGVPSWARIGIGAAPCGRLSGLLG